MKRAWVFHPILIGLFPVLFLYSHNAQETSPLELLVPCALVLVLAGVVWGLSAGLCRGAGKGAAVASLCLFFFFSFGHVLSFLNQKLTELSGLWVLQAEVSVNPLLILALEGLVLAVAIIFFRRRRETPGRLNAVLNVFALILIVLPAGSAVSAVLHRPAQAVTSARARPTGSALPASHPLGRKPDIYYIILDGYARSDILKQIFHYDNKALLGRLTHHGFYIATESRANYCQTPLCLASSLNMRYLENSNIARDEALADVQSLIAENTVAKTLKQHGYQFISFATGFDQTDIPHADIYLSPIPRLTEFQWMLVSTTPLASALVSPSKINPYQLDRKRTLYALDQLPRIALRPEPTFTFAHIVCPHPPFVFGEHGEDVSPYDKMYRLTDGDQFQRFYGDRLDYIVGYRKQVTFISDQIRNVISQILAKSPEPPIIVLQSDHGSGLGLDIISMERSDLQERMSILNAYFLPGGGEADLYPSITPVNTFRVILNRYFGTKLDLVEDRSYYSSWPEPMVFHDVTDRLREQSATGAAAASAK